MSNKTQPAFQQRAFHCPHCGAYAHQLWKGAQAGTTSVEHLLLAYCQACSKYSAWVERKMVFPIVATAPLNNPDMPEAVRALYLEAREVSDRSARAACALLRLAVSQLCAHLKAEGETLDDQIAGLTEHGLPKRVEHALASVRVIGKRAVMPGQVVSDDTDQVAQTLFLLVNLMTESLISSVRMVDEVYARLPKSA